jgi:ElaB/YqjD/DUF883 family membrane-anchored ribosome-binding protein
MSLLKFQRKNYIYKNKLGMVFIRMSYKDNGKEEKKSNKEEKEKTKVRWELNDIRDELMFELDDLYDDLQDEIEDIREDADDIKEDLSDDLDDLMDERESLLREVGDFRGDVAQYGDDARDKIENAKEKLERLKEKIRNHETKFNAKVMKKVDKAKRKAARINISVDPDMSEEWRDWADGLGASVSELVRKSMKFVKNNIGDIAKLEKLGEDIESAVKESGLEGIGEKIEKKISKKKGEHKIKFTIDTESKKDQIKKRVTGLIKLHKSLPIDKLAQALEKSDEDAENMIYELVAEEIEGNLEEGVFKFTSSEEKVIAKMNELIDNM